MSDCQGCPEQATDTPGVLNEIPRENHMVSTVWDLPKHRGILYSSVWIIFTGGPPEAHLFAVNRIIPVNRIKVTREGHIEYKKGPDDFEPPSPINGFCRDEENDHLFLPLWESCTWRQFGISFKTNCQCIDVLARCGKISQIVDYDKCKQCDDRMPILEMVISKKKTISSLRYPEGLPIHSSKPKRHGTVEHKLNPTPPHGHPSHSHAKSEHEPIHAEERQGED